MACAKCSFYLPKDSTKTPLLEEGLTAYEQLLAKLVDVPTPEGPRLLSKGARELQMLGSCWLFTHLQLMLSAEF
jgi:hypothetical protein